MGRHGENIRKRKDGRWEGRYPVYSEEQKKKLYCSVYGRTYEEVRDKLFEQRNRNGLEKPGDMEEMDQDRNRVRLQDLIFSDLAEDWLKEVAHTRKPSTYAKYRLVFDTYLRNPFPGARLSAMTDQHVRERLPDALTESTGRSIYCVLNQILKYASRQYSVAVPDLKRPLCCGQNKPVVVLARKEQTRLFLVLGQEPDSFKTAVSFCLYTGLRLGELCALKWTDIDFDNRLVAVNRTVQRLAVEGQRTRTMLLELEPKSEYSRREIPLSSAVLELLLRFPSDKEYIFGGDKPVEPRTMQNRFKKLLQAAGLPERNFHILRHTFATNCIEGGTDVKSLSEILGHSDVKITLNRYVHPSMDTKRKHLDILSGFYGQIHGQMG